MISTKLLTSIITAATVAGAIGVTVAQAQPTTPAPTVGTNKNIESTGAMRAAQNPRPAAAPSTSSGSTSNMNSGSTMNNGSSNMGSGATDSTGANMERAPRADRN